MSMLNHDTILRSGTVPLASIDGFDPDVGERLFEFMLRLRVIQEEIIRRYHPADEMRCPVHFCVGQEAVPAVVSTLVRDEDYLLSHHRSHGYYFAKGCRLDAMLAELHGKATGADGGLAGSQEISDASRRFFSGAIISGMLGMGVGVGLGQKLRRQSGIAVGVLGDAATEEGVFWEAVSYATMCRLPVLLICENNRYSTYSPQNKRQPQDNIHERVASFRMRSTALFANDVVAAHRHIAEAFEYVRGGQGPAFVEAYTYRWVGHVGPEDDDYLGYRPASEREFWMNHCPIRLLEERLRGAGMLAAGRRECIEKQVRAELVEGFEFARRSPFPAVAAWEPLNYCASAPLADRLLRDETGGHAFNQNQHDTMPAPY